jgi:pyruvate formate lyase activating enzyme
VTATETSDKGVVFSIQRYCIDDGPGIRTTVFMKGCPLRCLWCSNPESQSSIPEVGHRSSVCIRCGSCMQVCTNQAIAMDDEGKITVDRGSASIVETVSRSAVPEPCSFWERR